MCTEKGAGSHRVCSGRSRRYECRIMVAIRSRLVLSESCEEPVLGVVSLATYTCLVNCHCGLEEAVRSWRTFYLEKGRNELFHSR